MKHILILGANGQLGTAFKTAPWPPDTQVTTLTHSELNVSDPKSLHDYLINTQPFQAVINTAVFMPVDACEKDPEQALQTNGIALFHLAQACKAHGALLVHFSTDYVFDGLKGVPYTETDTKNPLNVYGRSKYMGELILESLDCPYLLIRSSWIFSTFGQNFVRKVLEWSAQDREITIVDDQIGCPTYAGDLVEATISMILTQLEKPEREKDGTYHLCGKGETSWYEYATFILEEIASVQTVKARLNPIGSKAYQEKVAGVADRPPYAALSCEKIRSVYGISQKDWKESVRAVVKQLVQGA
jgi:dTDP-4-dehydrorhamnose reductase